MQYRLWTLYPRLVECYFLFCVKSLCSFVSFKNNESRAWPKTHIQSACVESMFWGDNLLPKLLSADAERVAAGALSDNENFMGPVLHELLQVLRQAALLQTHWCAYFVVAVVSLSLRESYDGLMRGGCGASGWLLGLSVSPWSCSRPCEDTHKRAATPCLLSWRGIVLETQALFATLSFQVLLVFRTAKKTSQVTSQKHLSAVPNWGPNFWEAVSSAPFAILTSKQMATFTVMCPH